MKGLAGRALALLACTGAQIGDVDMRLVYADDDPTLNKESALLHVRLTSAQRTEVLGSLRDDIRAELREHVSSMQGVQTA